MLPSLPNWPEVCLDEVPDRTYAEVLANEVNQCTTQGGMSEGRTDLSRICRAGGFSTRSLSFSQFRSQAQNLSIEPTHEALLLPIPDGFAILVNSDVPKPMLRPVDRRPDGVVRAAHRRRYRFRIAHEIAHSFFYDRRTSPPLRTRPPSSSEEGFCDAFAASLLLPPSIVRASSPNPDSILALSRVHDVSAEAVGRSFAERPEIVCVLGLVYSVNPRTGRDLDWRVAWSAGTFVPKIARLHSQAVRATTVAHRASGVEELQVGRLRGRFYVDAARSDLGSQVIAVLTRPGSTSTEPAIAERVEQLGLFAE
jgi:hypothetical protein